MNPASEYVEASRQRSPVHEYIADNGQAVAKQDIKHTTIAGNRVALSDELTTDERTLVEEAMQARTTSEKACFVNALKLWEYDTRLRYTEGFAAVTDLNYHGIEHAWSMIDGEKLVDVTQAFDLLPWGGHFGS